MLRIYLALILGVLVCPSFARGGHVQAGGTLASPSIVAPGELPQNVDPNKLQFLLDLGGEGKNKKLAEIMESATLASLNKNTKIQRTYFIAAALQALETLPKQGTFTEKDLEFARMNAGYVPRSEIDRTVQNVKNSENFDPEMARIFFTAKKTAESLNETEISSLTAQFESFHWDYLEKNNPAPQFPVKRGKDGLSAIIAGMLHLGLIDKTYLHPAITDQARRSLATGQNAEITPGSLILEAETRAQSLQRRIMLSNNRERILSGVPGSGYTEEVKLFRQKMQTAQVNFTRQELLRANARPVSSFIDEHYRSNGRNYGQEELGMYMAYKIGLEMTDEPAPSTQPASSTSTPVDPRWQSENLPKIREIVLALPEWFSFTSGNTIVTECQDDGVCTFNILDNDLIKKPLNAAIEKGAVSPLIKALVDSQKMTGWLKIMAENKWAVRLTQTALETTSLGKGLTDSAVNFVEQLFKLHNIPHIVKPEDLTHGFAKTFDAWGKYAGSEVAKKAEAELIKSGLIKSSGMALMNKAIARSVILEATVDIVFRAGGALWNGQKFQNTTVGGQTYQIRDRNTIQMTGNASRDRIRNREAALEDAWAEWNSKMIQNTAKYVAGGVTTAVATPVVFGLAAAAGAPTAGIGSVVVAAVGYSVVALSAAAAVKGAESLTAGVDDGVNLWKIEDRLAGIYIDMKINQGRSYSDAKTKVSQIIQSVQVRYVQKQQMRFMVFVDDFKNVQIKTENGLQKFSLHQEHGNFIDSSRVNSWENYLIKRGTDIATLGVSAIWRGFSDWWKGDSAYIEKREARIAYDFYDMNEQQGQWDDYSNKVVNIGKIGLKGVIFVGTRGDKLRLGGHSLQGTHEQDDIRILSNGIVMSRNEKDRARWVMRGKCSEFDLFVREEVGPGWGRYICNNNTYTFMRHLSPPAAQTSFPVAAMSVIPDSPSPRSTSPASPLDQLSPTPVRP